MNGEQTYTTCPTCGQRIDPGEPGAVYAVKLVSMPGFGSGAGDVGEGLGAYFHDGCFPEGSEQWRRK
jgi:hypothetical protein